VTDSCVGPVYCKNTYLKLLNKTIVNISNNSNWSYFDVSLSYSIIFGIGHNLKNWTLNEKKLSFVLRKFILRFRLISFSDLSYY
jgi:hypothetical protein